MGGFNGLVVLVASFLLAVQCDVGCKGTDGHPGESGSPGRDGLPGMKGQKGEPALIVEGPADPFALLRLKGEKGSLGLQGALGPKGYQGELGATGLPGEPGPPGDAGRKFAGQGISHQEVQYSAFSVIRNESSYPAFSKKITYQSAVVNHPGDFNMTTGCFECRIPGVYYFTFHSVAKATMCLSLVSDSMEDKLTFCDYIGNRQYEQVLSGGVVLKLAAREKVWLESYRDNQLDADKRDNQEKHIIFNGFLLFSNSE